jgi:Flp pilus assembly protein TadB
LNEEGYSLVVLYDPLDPSHNTIHKSGNRVPVWWLRLSILLAALVLWFVFIVYPRLKRSPSFRRVATP